MISISFFICCQKLFTHMNISIIVKDSIELPEKEDFDSYFNMEDIADADYVHANKFVKILR